MAADAGDAFQVLGRFAMFWGFVLKSQFRQLVLEEWRREPRPLRFLSLLEGCGNAAIGLFPIAALGMAIWWLL
jgi:hypothetical protein